MSKITQEAHFIELEKRANAYKWGSFKAKNWSDWGLLFRFLVVVCRLLDKENTKIKKPRKPSAWATFLGQEMRKGKNIKEAAELWKQSKNSNSANQQNTKRKE